MERFFVVEESEEKIKKKKFNEIVFECVTNKTMTQIESLYVIDSIGKGGSLVNSNWFVEIINRQNNEKLCRFVKNILPHIYKKTKGQNEIRLISSQLTNVFAEFKKDSIIFNSGQKKTINDIFNFLPDFNKKSYGAYGYAGTGKTTIIVEIISFLLLNKMIKSIAFTAPTNQALYVIKAKFRPYLKEIYCMYSGKELDPLFNFDNISEKMFEFNINIDFITIHKLLKFEREYDLDGMIFVKNKNGSLISQYELVIIDECSMIPVMLAEHIFNELRPSKIANSDIGSYEHIPKVIFLGDNAQLPPVKENISVIFAKSKNDLSFVEFKKIITLSDQFDQLDKSDNNTNVLNQSNNSTKLKTKIPIDIFENLSDNNLKLRYDMLMSDVLEMQNRTLKMVMRSKHPEVTNVCYQIRLWALGETTEPKLGEYITGNVKAYKYINSMSKLKTMWFEKCLEQHKNGKNYNIILTWTNNQSDEYNKAIRLALFKNEDIKLERFMEGDILMLNKFYNMDDGKVSFVGEQTNEKKYYTSEQIKVIKVEQLIKTIPDLFVNLTKSAKKVANIIHYDTKLKQTIDKINKVTKRNYLCWKLTVTKNKDTTFDKSNDLNVVYVVHEKCQNIYEMDKTLAQYEIKNLSNLLIAKFGDKFNIINTHIIRPLSKEYFIKFDEPFADVSYGYSITCHKGQGSSFYNVFIDVDDVLKNIKQSESRHCLYTAVTRTSNEMHLLV